MPRRGKRNYFMGTDFTYEDMEPEDLDNFNYNILRSEQFNHEGKAYDSYVIEALPANDKKKQETGYAKRIMWIEKVNLTTLKTDFYDRRDKHQKTQLNYKYMNVGGAVMRPMQTIMNNMEKSHKTATTTRSRKININMADSTFTEQFILSGKHLE